jgi:hypothetical protein
MKHYLLSSALSVKEKYQRRAFIAVGVVIGWRRRRRKEKSISPNASYAAMETVSV